MPSTLPSWCLCVPAAYIKPCSLNDPKLNACAKQHAIDAIPHFINGKYVLHQVHFVRSRNKAKAEVVPARHADVWWSAGTAPRTPKLCTKRRWPVIFTRWSVRPDKHWPVRTRQENALAPAPVGTQWIEHIKSLTRIESQILGHAVSTFAISASFHLYTQNRSAVAVHCGWRHLSPSLAQCTCQTEPCAVRHCATDCQY